MADTIQSLHILGSREFGGADQFYVRLVRALWAEGQPVTAINRPDSPVAKALEADPVRQVHVPLANNWDLWSRWRISREVTTPEPCVVQTYMGRATRLTHLPPNSKSAHVARLGGFYKIDGYYRHADAWVGNTRAICDFLVRGGIPARRVYHIGNFVPDAVGVSDEQKTELKRLHRIPDDAWVIFGLGRLIPKKGFVDLLHAMACLPKQIAGRPVVLLIAGDGSQLPVLEALATQLGLEDRVRFLGWQNSPEAYYSVADVFVCPSRHEPLGNVILEAWNYRVPVVSTRNDGAMELIQPGETGLLCECGDPASIAAQLLKILEAPAADRQALGLAGNAYLGSHYSRHSIVSAYLSLYRELLQAKA